jgi:hypothetical protein
VLSRNHGSAVFAVIKIALDFALLRLVDLALAIRTLHLFSHLLLHILLKRPYSKGSGSKCRQPSHVSPHIFSRRRAQ